MSSKNLILKKSLYYSLIWAAVGTTSYALANAKTESIKNILNEYKIKKTSPASELIIDEKLAQKLESSKITWYDLQTYNVGIKTTVAPAYLENFFLQEEKIANRFIDKQTSISKPSQKTSHRDSSACPIPSKPREKATFLAQEVTKILQSGGSNVKESPVLDNLISKYEIDSITQDEKLMRALYVHATKLNKGFASIDELKDSVKRGEIYSHLILSGNTKSLNQLLRAMGRSFPGYPRTSQEKKEFTKDIFISILWYFEAKCGQKVILNPATWQPERGFVNGGTIRFVDGPDKTNLHRMFEFFVKLGSYSRMSTHYKEESIGKHQGFDIKGTRIQLPGKENTRTVLFGKLKNNETFIKPETHGVSLTNPIEVIEHTISWLKHRQKEKAGINNDPYSHRESLNKKVVDNYNKYLTEKFETDKRLFKKSTHKKSAISLLEKDYKAALSKSKLGVAAMLETLQTKAYKDDPKAKAMSDALVNYVEQLCHGSAAHYTNPKGLHFSEAKYLEAMKNSLKGCEAIIYAHPIKVSN